MRSEYTRLLGLQCAITITGSTLNYFVVSHLAAESFAYGSSIALVSTLWLTWRVRQSERHEGLSVESCLWHVYQAAIERFLLVVFLLALGFKLLEFASIWILAGFVSGQSAWLFVPVLVKIDNAK